MKKTAIILFTFLFILTSCSNPEDTKRIEKLESKENIFNKNIECKKLENNIKEKLKKYDWDNNIHEIDNLGYSKNLNSCIYSYSIMFKAKTETLINYKIINYFSGEELESKQCNLSTYTQCNKEIFKKFLEYTN